MTRMTNGVVLTGACALGLVLATPVNGQQPRPASAVAPTREQITEAVAMTRAGFKVDHKQIVASNLELTPEEATRFWPVFDQYRAAMEKAHDRLFAILINYSMNQTTLTDAQAREMVDEYMKFEREEIDTRTAWVPKLAAVIPAKKLARFVQIENKIESLMRGVLADGVPLVK